MTLWTVLANWFLMEKGVEIIWMLQWATGRPPTSTCLFTLWWAEHGSLGAGQRGDGVLRGGPCQSGQEGKGEVRDQIEFMRECAAWVRDLLYRMLIIVNIAVLRPWNLLRVDLRCSHHSQCGWWIYSLAWLCNNVVIYKWCMMLNDIPFVPEGTAEKSGRTKRRGGIDSNERMNITG